MKTKLTALLLTVLLLAAIPFAAVAETETEPNAAGPDLSFESTTLAGDPIDSSIIKDYDLIMVNFWSPYDHDLEALEQLYQAYDNLLIIGVNNWYNAEDALSFAQRYNVTYPMIRGGGVLDTYFESMRYREPTTIFFNSAGKRVGGVYSCKNGYDYWASVVDRLLTSPSHAAELSFSGETLSGDPIDSSIIENYDLIVVNFWAEWCGPCMDELPAIQQISEEYDNVLILGAYLSYSPEYALTKAQEQGVTYPCLSLCGTLEEYAERFNSIPATYFFNACGEEIGFPMFGSRSYDSWKEAVDEMLPLTRVKPKITTQPKTANAAEGTTARFKVKAKGRGITYQWYYRTSPTGSWKKMSSSSAKKPTLAMTAKAQKNGWQFRCQIKSANGLKAYTKAATLNVGKAPTIVTQPTGKTAKSGDKVKLMVTAKGDNLTYQWYYRTSSKAKWKKVPVGSGGASYTGTKASYSFKASAKKSGYQYRCLITNPFGKVYSETVKVKVK